MTNRNDANEEPLVGFDQTNGVVEGLEGESDGTAEGERAAEADRDTILPIGRQDTFASDHYGDGGTTAAD